MNLHEYQSKEILSKYGVAIQRGFVANNVDEAVEAADKLKAMTGAEGWVVKAQVHAGGRGKGGGVKFSPNMDKLKENANNILGMRLVTPQTSAEGKLVNSVLIAEDVYYPGASETKEFYVSILLDRALGKNTVVYSTEGGMDIEQVAEETPHLIHKEVIDPTLGLLPFQANKIAFNLGLEGQANKEFKKFITALYNAYIGIDASLFEINPVLKTSDDKIIAVDAKVTLDGNALYRHKDLAELRDKREEDPMDVEAGEAGLNFVKLDGDVACMVNGAGLAMATMDMIKLSGGNPANFLDVGGTADAARVKTAFEIILKDENVKAILINIFGGIVRCDRVAQGVVDAYKQFGNFPVPLIVRLQGTNAEEAKKLIDEAGLPIHSAITLEEAANKVKEVLA
ncbi:ADP-forming succinate--CoA ligase subunit beta [Bergeyella zoohelcum]|uniref:Succinate--CoA ligase [ADP-forming] subunit beta n=2 Tax=Bergeyella zoohelcum TaxID=1015 RepID=K1LKV0_9FLAO|nr:ADP-forming succinate--CoA ligase subunit beta [Bergeyella zoohelcum]EKB57375.1 succinyl-CoA ligase [ADP-forming] subunit beta [Bergeyella zoohelcum ATCC 43767]EKB58524.1 succinyl-CoA ligase [ADP-forming] subunit beta [Bergeyella zoohelcum CCUG 30536]MDY6026595.1 ADP-forming succinate--CoA ligase subunit beta [Bergeyella zoohelcum]SSZ55893.1 Succinyl-CoA ligase [ADP-forming] subunit beta [Bergeyella zoohelcum]SUV48954.1 Succinyl-CoA ligase [ADP-forming] subunit beta [Bergeyella zoohelcum]